MFRRAMLLMLCVIQFGDVASAKNSGFKLNLDLNYRPGLSNMHFIAFPYFYFPDGDTSNHNQAAADVCFDLNGGPGDDVVESIRRFNNSSDTFTNKDCISPVPGFPIEKGIGYAVIPNSAISNPTTVVIVGSHDDEYASNKSSGTTKTIPLTYRPGLSNLHWLSVPYHWQPDPISPTNNVRSLCVIANGGFGNALVVGIRRFNPSSDTFSHAGCSITPGWEVRAGQSLAFIPNQSAPQPVNISFPVY